MAHLTAQQKVELIALYGLDHRLGRLVETGLYQGHGSGMHLPVFHTYLVVDCQAENVRSARAAGYRCWFGDSGELLPRMLAELDGPALFWLDAHGIVDDPVSWPGFPLHRELDAIANWEHGARSVILIDDIWMFGPGSPQPLRGAGEVSTLEWQVDQIGFWDRFVADEVMRLIPRRREV